MSIVVDKLSKRFAGRLVLEELSVEITSGELFVLLGASGSGKSTVLRLIAGLTSPDAGSITLEGRDVTDLPAQMRGVGFVFQNYSIFRHMTVRRNIEFGLKIRGVPAAKRRTRSEELLDLVGLGGLGDRFAHQLSGGQQQRVALARALAYEPRVLLLDEPFGALDVKIRGQLRRTLSETQRRLKVTTILVTHDQEEAFELGDRIGVIERGRLLEVGRPEELYRHPQSSFVATFLGGGMVLIGRCVGGQAIFGPVALPIPPEAPHEEGAPVRLLVRPEQVAWSESAPLKTGIVLGEGPIVEQTFSGALRRFRLRLPRLPRTRQIAPPSSFGEEALLVDAISDSTRPLPERAWASLSDWRILPQAEPRLLACARKRDVPRVAGAARRLAEMLEGSVTLLGVASDPVRVDRIRAELKEAADAQGWDVRVRVGAAEDQIVNEQAETFYDLVLLLRRSRRGRRRPTVQGVIARSSTPVLFVAAEPSRFERILICTRVGEPGKTDVRAGGWLAARLGARVTLLHVAREGEETPTLVRTHLEQGVATLHGLDVAAESRIRPAASAVEGILEEARAESADLIVLGSHGPRSRSVRARDDVTLQVLLRADRPVLVVPAGSW